MNNPVIAFVGGGNMASSIIGGLIENGVAVANILVSDPVAAGRQKLEEEFGVVTATDNTEICGRADIIVLAVKPQILKSVAEGIAAVIPDNAVVVSIAAGIPLSALQLWLGQDKAMHAGASFALTLSGQLVLTQGAGLANDRALPISAGTTLALGVMKELTDRRRDPHPLFSWRDLVADALGVAVAAAVVSL